MTVTRTGSMTGADLMLAAARREPVDRTPIWFMRQAGRCLAGYRALRETHDILTITRTPELCAQVTLMPVEEFGVDAAVMYADIMLPLIGMDVPFSIDPGVGPLIHAPVRSAADVAALRIVDPREANPELFAAIRLVRGQLDGKTAVVGFAGGPFTVASYMIEGKPTKDFSRTKAMLYGEPELWHRLMSTLTEVTISYLEAQVEAGAQMIQLFDSWAGALSVATYTESVLPYSRRILEAVAHTGVPTIHFGTTTAHLLEAMASAGSDVISVDWRLPLDVAWRRIGARAIQGNLDPGVMLAPFQVVAREARQILALAGGRPGHIFNLGHGVLPETSSDHLKRLAELVHEESART
jgi:uroporphyrinogen decarboxylase